MKPLLTLCMALLMLSCSQIAHSKQTFKVEIKAPSSCEILQITQAYYEYGELLLVAKVYRPGNRLMCMTMISTVADSVELDIDKPTSVKKMIIGKHWCWQRPSQESGYYYVKSQAQFDAMIKDKTKIFDKPLGHKLDYKGFEAGKDCQDKNMDESR